MKRVYFAHSKITYNTSKERKERTFLEETFEDVLCPNRDMGELGGIEPYLKKLKTCDAVVCSEYLEHIGKGVFTEIKEALNKKIPVYCLRIFGNDYKLEPVRGVKVVDEDDWKIEYGRVVIEAKSPNA